MSQAFSSIKRNWAAVSTAAKAAFKAFKLAKSDRGHGSFEPLIPVGLEDGRFMRYEQELLKALRNDDVLNIALTGGYGAGKSSVLKTFFDRHSEFPHALVSLATFSKNDPVPALSPPGARELTPASEISNPDNRENADASSATTVEAATPPTTDLINRIEETIVQQLLYTVPSKKLPKTRLKRIAQSSMREIALQVCWISALSVSVLTFFTPKLAKLADVDIGWLLTGLGLIPHWLAIGTTMVLGAYALFQALRFWSLFSIDGLTLKGGKLEATNHGSVLHKNIDEIIYCFERSEIQVVVIEDLDRFDTQDIFFRLREINFIIRQSPQIKRPVHFIYAIRDELFTLTDKTKFFDLIIPVIPVINSENSREKMFELLAQRQINGRSLEVGLTHSMVENVCYYIDDMRLIKNIVNEFDMYASLLANGGIQLNPNKLFAIVVIKNLHPGAFTALLKRSGVIYDVLTGYAGWVAEQIAVAGRRIVELDQLKAKRDEDVVTHAAHLRAVVWYEVVKLGGLNTANHIRLRNNTDVELLDFVEDSQFEAFLTSQRVVPVLQGSYNRSAGQHVSVDQALAGCDYQARLATLQTALAEVDEERQDLLKKTVRLKTIPFREGARTGYGQQIAQKLKDYGVVSYFMRRGLFDTDYADYLGYFYEGSITQVDKNVILALSSGETLDVATQLSHPDRVASKLDLDGLDGGRGLVAGLLSALAQDQFGLASGPRQSTDEGAIEQAEMKLALVLKTAHGHMDRFAEAMTIILPTPSCGAVVQAIREVDSNLIFQLLKSDRFKAPDARQTLVMAILNNLSAEQAETLHDRQGLFLHAVNEISNIAPLMPHLDQKAGAWAWLREQPAQFEMVDEGVAPGDLRRLVEWGCLSFSLPMLKLLWAKFGEEASTSGAVSMDRLKSLGLPGFAEKVDQEAADFAETLLVQEGLLPETVESLAELVAKVSPDEHLMMELVERTDCRVMDLRAFPVPVWVSMLDGDRVMPRAEAVWTFFEEILLGLDESNARSENEGLAMERALLAYIALHATELASRLWSGGHDQRLRLQSFLVGCEAVDNQTLKTLFNGQVLDESVMLTTGLPSSRWSLFAGSDFVPYSESIQKAFSELAFNHLGRYISRRWSEAREKLKLSELPISIAHHLTRSNTASAHDAVAIWAGIPFDAYDTHPGSATELASVCRRVNAAGVRFDQAYLPVILKVIADVALSHADRIEMLIQALELGCEWADLPPVLSLLGDQYLVMAGGKGRAHLPPSLEDQRLVMALTRRDFVGKYKIEDKRIVVYCKRVLGA
ncbi:YobI family P-loop NTPase [Pseudomonas syringae]|uniref:YobI family P-loop NTPase n=1 Tax=Pseudomonas syringae TaxID=317 RepID=UPI003F754C7D